MCTFLPIGYRVHTGISQARGLYRSDDGTDNGWISPWCTSRTDAVRSARDHRLQTRPGLATYCLSLVVLDRNGCPRRDVAFAWSLSEARAIRRKIMRRKRTVSADIRPHLV